MNPNLTISQEAIADFCRKHHIRKMSLFGSVLRDDFRPDSDIDLLIEFEPGHEPNLRGLLTIQRELEAIFEREVDVGEFAAVREDPNYIRRNIILNSARAIYEG